MKKKTTNYTTEDIDSLIIMLQNDIKNPENPAQLLEDIDNLKSLLEARKILLFYFQ